MLKKRIRNCPLLDLHNYTPEALRKIKSLTNIAMLIVSDGDERYTEALAEIDMKNIASRIFVPHNKEVNIINGMALLTNETVKKDNVYLVNGIVLIDGITEDKGIGVISNGTTVVNEGASVNIIQSNGEVTVEKFDRNNLIKFENKCYVDANFLKEVNEGVMLVCDNKIYIEESVTVDMLREKYIRFICGNKIICQKELWGYVQSHAFIANKIAENDENPKWK